MRRLATSLLRCSITTLSAILIRHLERQPQRPHEHWASPIATLLGSLRSRLRTSLRSAPLRAPPSTPASQKRGPRHSILDPIHNFLSLSRTPPLQLSLALQWSNFRVRLSPATTSPGSTGGFLQRFPHPRSLPRFPDDLIRASLALDSALSASLDLPRQRSAISTLQGVLLKSPLILARWLIHRAFLPQSITDAFAESVRFLIGGPRFGLSQRGRRGMIRQSPIGFLEHGHVGFANSTDSDLD